MRITQLRPATLKDSDMLLSWANNPDSLKWKQTTFAEITPANHEKWLKVILSNKAATLWIILAGEKAVGQVRLEKKIDMVHADIYVKRDSRGKGHAYQALKIAIEKYCATFGSNKFTAVIHKDNKESQNLFKKHRFVLVEHGEDDWLYFEKFFAL